MKLIGICIALLFIIVIPGKVFTQDVVKKKGYNLTFESNDAALDPSLKKRLIETFFEVYPKLSKEYNKNTLREVHFLIDTAYHGVAATHNGRVVFSAAYMQKHSQDIDVVTHEVMHIVQDYKQSVGPGWLTEGIADYARYKFGVNNEAANWSLPAYKAGQSYTNSYRITAAFFSWLEKNQYAGLVKKLDAKLRDHTYSAQAWEELTGKTLDELWAAYASAKPGTSLSNTVNAQAHNIKNDIFWNTKDAQPINSQGGGIFKFDDPTTGEKKYYWYGVHYKEADTYRNNPSITLPTSTFESVTCYSSTDLVNWTFEGDVLTREELKKQDGERRTWVGRLGVAYIKELNKYAMFVQHGSQVLITVSNTPTGQFTWHQQISMKDMIGTTNTGDQTVFTDEDNGKSYLVYSYGQGRNKIYVSEIGVKDGMVNLLDCNKIFQGAGREGNCMFKYKGRYYMFASNLYGWDASLAYYLVADNVRGPYLPTNEMLVMNGSADDYAHITQTGFFFNVKGSKRETVIYCGDRWADFAGNGLGYNQWFPVSFEDKAPYFNSLSSWNLNAKTGEWNVAADNNFVKNASFEADRKYIPSTVKPVQQQLTGWMSTVIEGNKISLDSLTTPVLNHNNSESDRKFVIGEKSLAISDKVSFKRKVFQLIESSPFVKLENGSYTLTAKVKNSSGFAKLEMHALSNGKTVKYNITDENSIWKTIKIDNIMIRNGKVEVGFIAEGSANAFCYVDDISLVKMK